MQTEIVCAQIQSEVGKVKTKEESEKLEKVGDRQIDRQLPSIRCIRRFLNTSALELFYSSSSASIQPLHPQSRPLSAGVNSALHRSTGGWGRVGFAYSSSSCRVIFLRYAISGSVTLDTAEMRQEGSEREENRSGKLSGRVLSIQINKLRPFTHL